MRADVTVLVCAHNEEAYIEESLNGILRQTTPPSQIILVADRCSDRTVELSKAILPRSSIIIQKEIATWKNSYSENLEIGRRKTVSPLLAIVDADILVPPQFLEEGAALCKDWASVSALVRTDPRPGLLNHLVSFWERSYLLNPLGREPRGGARIISTVALVEVGGFRDVRAPDSDLDIRLKRHGERVKMDTSLVALHLRRMDPYRSVLYQIDKGKARRQLGISPLRTFLHSVVRLRPLVIFGYIISRPETNSNDK